MRTRILRCVAGALAGSGGAAAWAQSDVTALGQVTVVAGQFPTGETPGSVLNTLEIVTTPGAQADINRALQTLPGVQLPDEGNALFVRGGDSFETVTVVNGIRFPTATHLDDPSGTFQGTINPFEAQRVDFQSGGFGAQFGNALSGVVDLDTVGAPAIHGVTIGGGLGALSVGGQQPIGEDAGIRVEGTFTDTAPIFRLNGSSQDFPDPPHGHDFALEGSWDYRPGAELRWFAVEQTQGLGLLVDQPYLQGNSGRTPSTGWARSRGRISLARGPRKSASGPARSISSRRLRTASTRKPTPEACNMPRMRRETWATGSK